MGLALVAALVAAGQTSSGKRESDVWTERGRVALAEYRYHDAAEAFQKVIAISPDLAAAHAQLARALLGEAPPNPLLFPDTNGFLPKAEAEARKAVDLSPADPEALSTLASVDHKLADSTRDPAERSVRLAEVTSLWNKILAADPRSAQAHSELARIAVERVAPAIIMARAQSGMAFQDKARLRDPALRRSLRSNHGHTIADAILHAQKALDIDPAYVPAMHAMSTLLLMRANLSDSDADYAADFKASEDWQQKAANATPKPAAAPVPLPNNGGIIGAMISEIRVPPGTTTLIFAPPEVAERNLLSKIEPSYPEAARKAGVQGTVRFRAVIGTDGHVKTLDLVQGDPRLAKAAEDAVRKWVYRPFVADGITRDAATEISVPFKLEAASPPSNNR
jgi:TonB family protein